MSEFQTNKKCWAHPLGNCSIEMSKEHIFSECLLDKMVTLHGISTIPEIMIGKSAASSMILCKTHNNQLSDVDSEAGQMKASLKEIHDRLAATDPLEIIEGYPKIVNGLLFERWCLKTLINCLVVNNPSYKPSWDIVEMAFGIRPFDSALGQGVYLIDPSHHQNEWVNQNKVFFESKMIPANQLITDERDRQEIGNEPLILGCIVNVFGFHFWLRILGGTNLSMSLNGVQLDRLDHYRHESFVMKRSKLSVQHLEKRTLPLLKFIYKHPF